MAMGIFAVDDMGGLDVAGAFGRSSTSSRSPARENQSRRQARRVAGRTEDRQGVVPLRRRRRPFRIPMCSI